MLLGNPEIAKHLPKIEQLMCDESPAIASKAIYSVGKFSADISSESLRTIAKLLFSDVWKINSSCLFAISVLGERAPAWIVDALIVYMKGNKLNKQAIAETILRLGTYGEKTLIKIVRDEQDLNSVIKPHALKAFWISRVEGPLIEEIVEVIFENLKSRHAINRYNSLFALHSIYNKKSFEVVILSAEAYIAYLDRLLGDSDSEVRKA